jgi:hypothetical protein
MQAKGDPVTRETMQLKALEIAQEMNIAEKGFTASLGCCRRMRRYDLSLRDEVPVLPHLLEDLTAKPVTYQQSVLALRRAHDYQGECRQDANLLMLREMATETKSLRPLCRTQEFYYASGLRADNLSKP